jgi:penicillin-binding protein 1A
MAPARIKVVVANPADGGFIYWLLKFYLFGAFTLALLALASLPAIYLAVAARAPDAPELRRYGEQAGLPSQITTADGMLLTELAKEHRQLVSVRQVPRLLISAFLAAEDRAFYRHGGVDVRGILRAAWANLRAGAVRQGGSTITQQVAKAHLSPERTIQRKAFELVLARRIEAKHSKDEILEFYLNHVFFGSNAYGIKAAADEYFGKRLDQLTTGEMALLGGLVRAPSRYSPRRNLRRATRRRDQVLAAMHAAGFIDAKQLAKAKAEKLKLRRQRAADPLRRYAPHVTEWVRRLLVRRYGRQRVYRAGWSVSTTVDLPLQKRARHYTTASVEALDKRQGWRGPVDRLRTRKQRERALKRIEALYGPLERLREDFPYLAVVDRVTPSRAKARIGKRQIEIPLALAKWAHRYSRTNAKNKLTVGSVKKVLEVGDLIWVISPKPWMRRKTWGGPKDAQPIMALDQRPRVEGVLYTYDHQSGYVLAMIGGLDYDRSTFNRAVQACRQPGSTYKPIYYALALDDAKHSMGMILQDRPYKPEPGEEWNPKNVHGTLDGKVTMHFSLVKSLNLPAIQVLHSAGGCVRDKRNRCRYPKAAAWARRLGFTTRIHPDKALALGASCVHTDELTRAFATFARGGTQRDPIYIRQVRDRHGALLEDHTVPVDPLLSEDERLDRLWATSARKEKQIIDPRTAFLITKLLRDSVLYGIAARCQIVPVPTGGKGGTSSRTMDVWFVGFTSRWATTAWVGDDSYRRMLGEKEASYTAAIPMWANFMRENVGGKLLGSKGSGRPYSELPLRRPKGLRSAVIDFQTGGPPKPGDRTVRIYYRPGSWSPPGAGAAKAGP